MTMGIYNYNVQKKKQPHIKEIRLLFMLKYYTALFK